MDNTQGWVKRPKGLRGIPAGLLAHETVEFVLAGDPAVRQEEVFRLNWGDGPGEIERFRRLVPEVGLQQRKHGHYFKSVQGLDGVDVYRVLELFEVSNPSIAHAIKKLMVAGGRGAGKDIRQDVQEAIDSLTRWQEMRAEDQARSGVSEAVR